MQGKERLWAINSVVECFVHIEEVAGSNPALPTKINNVPMATIKKKCWPEFFNKFCTGERKFELRLADFDLKSGDILIFEEYNPDENKYTGRSAKFYCNRVEHSAQNPLQFYKVADVKKYGFWIVELKRK